MASTPDEIEMSPEVARFFSNTDPSNMVKKLEAMTVEEDEPEVFHDAAPEEEKKAEELKPKTPYEEYIDTLKAEGITLDTARKIVDAMTTKGVYTERVKVTSKMSVVFRTRSKEHGDWLNEEMNIQNPKFQGTVFALIGTYNMAGSLAEYNGTKLTCGDREELDKTLAFIRRIPGPVYNVLVEKLAKFDHKVNTVMKEGAIENF